MPIYAFGSNGNGQLGTGHKEDLFSPQMCKVDIPDTSIAKIAAGGNHSAILTVNGEIYFAGDNSYGQCADVSSCSYQLSTSLSDRKWKDVACGWTFTILIEDASGQVYVIGTGSRGELGHGQDLQSTNTASPVDGVNRIVSVACGWRHVLAVREDGSVLGWGSGSHGQLGADAMASKSKSTRPMTIVTNDIISVACGQMHSVLLDRHGRVVTIGLNKHGQLGKSSPSDCPKSADQTFVQLPSPVETISCGWHHTMVLTRNGELWGWGRNDHCQLTSIDGAGDNWLDNPVRLSWKPVQLQQPRTATAVVCGSEHMLSISNNQAYAWGWNEHGNCASTEPSVFEPKCIQLAEPKMVAAGCGTSWVIAN